MTEPPKNLLEDRDIAQMQAGVIESRIFVANAVDYTDKALAHLLIAQEMLALARTRWADSKKRNAR